MSKIAIVTITEYDDGSVATIADSFAKSAEEKGHSVSKVNTIFSKSCHCGGHCCQKGGEGCGDDDCICTFAKGVPGMDCVVFAFPVDMGFSPSALNRIVHKITFNCTKSDDSEKKKVFVLSTSDAFDEFAFNDALSVIKMECNIKNWDYAGELLIPCLPDACIGADPVSRRQAAKLTEKI